MHTRSDINCAPSVTVEPHTLAYETVFLLRLFAQNASHEGLPIPEIKSNKILSPRRNGSDENKTKKQKTKQKHPHKTGTCITEIKKTARVVIFYDFLLYWHWWENKSNSDNHNINDYLIQIIVVIEFSRVNSPRFIKTVVWLFVGTFSLVSRPHEMYRVFQGTLNCCRI